MRFFGSACARNSLLSITMLFSLVASPGFSSAATQTPVMVGKVSQRALADRKQPRQMTAESLALLKQAYAEMGSANWATAIDELCRLIKNDPGNALARRYLAFSLMQSGNAREALSQLDALLPLGSPIPFDQCLRGDVLNLLGESDKASEAYRAALEMNPKSDYVRGKLIVSLRTATKYQAATAICAEGYFASQPGPIKDQYLSLFNELNRERVTVAQRNLGIQMEATLPFPLLIPTVPSKSATSPDDKKKIDSAQTADSDSDNDEEAAPAPPPPPKTVRNY